MIRDGDGSHVKVGNNYLTVTRENGNILREDEIGLSGPQAIFTKLVDENYIDKNINKNVCKNVDNFVNNFKAWNIQMGLKTRCFCI